MTTLTQLEQAQDDLDAQKKVMDDNTRMSARELYESSIRIANEWQREYLYTLAIHWMRIVLALGVAFALGAIIF